MARDFNGVSLESSEEVFAVCLEPDHIDRPYFVESTKTSIEVAWTKPDYTGGCPILSYHLLMKKPSGSVFEEVDKEQIENKPYLTQHKVEGLNELSGIYEFKI